MKTEEHFALSVTKLRGLEHLMYQFILGIQLEVIG